MQAERESLAQHDRLSQPSAEDLERWQMVRSLVHEMRSVLTAAKIGAEVLSGPRADDAAYRRGYAEMIAEQTGRVARLLEDFSELTRPTPPEFSPGEETADLNVALDAAGRELAGLAAHLEQEMILLPAPAAALIEGHQGRVTQALRGLLEYFLVSSPRGTTVEASVNLATSEADVVTVSLSRRSPEGSASLAQTLDWSRISPAAARRIVQDHGGSLRVLEEADKLSLVVTFPRERGVLAGALREWREAEADVWPLPQLRVAA
jgi:hypothetical protein